jgi:purine-binding chemotaxis protein CheW
VVFIADGTWGLACDELAQVVTLRPDEVRWRTSRTRRRWLAGTVIEHMCALLDPPVFADVLASGLEDMPDSGMQDEDE